jgi:hypothetical protein
MSALFIYVSFRSFSEDEFVRGRQIWDPAQRDANTHTPLWWSMRPMRPVQIIYLDADPC